MPKGLNKKRSAETYESDDGFVEDAPKSKKSKNTPVAGMQTDDEGFPYWEISGRRRLQITEFKGTTMISIREFYEKDGKTLPGKKGISMSVEQFGSVLELLPDVERALKKRGQKVPRPQYDRKASEGSDDADDSPDESEEEVVKGAASSKSSGRLEKYKHKANYEDTSDDSEG